MAPDPKDVLKLAAALVEAQKTLDALNTEWSALFAGAVPSLERTEPAKHPANLHILPKKRTRAMSQNSLPSKIVRFLHQRQLAATIGDIADAVGSTPGEVSRSMSRIIKNGMVQKLDRGLFRTAQQNYDATILDLGGNDQEAAEATS